MLPGEPFLFIAQGIPFFLASLPVADFFVVGIPDLLKVYFLLTAAAAAPTPLPGGEGLFFGGR